MTRIKRGVLINCKSANARPNCAIVLYQPTRLPWGQYLSAPSIKTLIMVIVIRMTVITVIMIKIAHAMIITNMIRAFSVLAIFITVPKR